MIKTLVVLLGPTGIGKTQVSINIAKFLKTEIVSSDSRQIYKEISIGTARPDISILNSVKHHLIGTHSIEEYFNAYMFEILALSIISEILQKNNTALLVGGSMMYIDAVCKGIDDLPTIDVEIRNELLRRLETEGLESLRKELAHIDPRYYKKVDLKNHKRILKALEVYYMTGKAYSSFLTKPKKERAFNIIKIGLEKNRDELYSDINLRVEKMIQLGLIDEAKEYYPKKHLNALNTVGYKELFEYFDGEINKEKAIELIKRNSRRYAKRQLSWFKRDNSINWFHPKDEEGILNLLKQQL